MTDDSNRPLKVFLCHAHGDRSIVRELYQRLKGEGWIDPWLDVAKILPGQHWTTVIRRSLAEADSVIILVSNNSIDREGFVQREMNYAWDLSLEKPRSVIYLIPLRLDDCEVPFDLRERHWADYFGDGKEETYNALLQSLKLRHEQKLRLEAEERARQEKQKREREAAEMVALEKAEKEAAEKARLEAEELAKQKAAVEKAEREATKKAAREEERRILVEKAEKEKVEHEVAEKAAREKAEKEAAEKARLENEENEKRKVAKIKAEREAAKKAAREEEKRLLAAKAAREKAEKEAAEKTVQPPPQYRILEAAIQKKVVVHKPASLYVWIKKVGSKSIVSVVKHDDGKNAKLDKKSVKSTEVEIEFPVENGVIGSASVSLRLVAPEFFPPTQQKEIQVPVDIDSQVYKFLVTPQKVGELLLNIEVLKGGFSVANQNLWTTAVDTEPKEESPMVLATIPLVIVVHNETSTSIDQSESISLKIGGNVQGNIIIGNDNQVTHIPDVDEVAARKKVEVEEHAEQQTEQKAPKINILKNRRFISIFSATFVFILLLTSLLIINMPIIRYYLAVPTITPTLTSTPFITFNFQTKTQTATFTPTKTKTPTITFTPTITNTPTPLPASIIDNNGVEMVLIPSGHFIMGYDKGTEAEDPQSKKYVDAFYIDKYEITNKLYKECVSAGVCKPSNKINSNTHADYYENRQFNDYPVINVDWHMAVTYCSWRDARLPTEPEWENAARGEDGRIYPWGNQAGYSYANYYNYKEDTTAVGSYEDGKSVYGVYDMAGNVREWTSSLFMVYPYKTNDGRENPDEKGARTFRGGSWNSASVTEIRTTYRSGADPSFSSINLGFRCVHPIPETPKTEYISGIINVDNSINCRFEPNLNSEIVDFLQPNSSVSILSRLADSSWLLVKVPGVESCWAFAQLITVTSGNLGDLPVNTVFPTSTVAP